ncbi:phosphogluconate dehydratase [Candidatus Thiothrix sp. Deng01]|uniref:Phosphogluconate dehydratase n=1 Tax=Candidatus Thiothrix phosphatis TaxID=3112415 RepID=A0ABU6CUQ6_9GAMM|nr:phosphogluconate dehydratase [Candidatus Thiothrix sp. Deng01]MEB4589807.1 phosphogluconate dehydratase [Candidatus Thiothrix sp. Deng01]
MNQYERLCEITRRIEERSLAARTAYLEQIAHAAVSNPRRHLGCGNLAHAVAAVPDSDKLRIVEHKAGNLGIVTAYNDMLSAHQPFEHYPELIKAAARAVGGTAQVAGGVPAMCDGVTQGQPGMELSLFSRDVIALSAAVALAHHVFDAAVFLGVCDKIVPGLVIAAASFGHLPCIFLPAGPMVSGLPNNEKSRVRQEYAAGKLGRDELLKAEMQSYHGVGTCTFYGTANSNQMLMEFMGLQLPGSSFINPGSPLRDALTIAGAQRALNMTAHGKHYTPAAYILTAKAFVNGIVGLNATGGSTNLLLHLVAMARAAGVILRPEDFADLSAITPLMARVYPNGMADVNHFHAAGGLQFVIRELLAAGLLHEDVETVAGPGLDLYTREAFLDEGGKAAWRDGAGDSHDLEVVRPVAEAFQPTGGLVRLLGNLGDAVIKVSAVKPDKHLIEAPAKVFHDQKEVKTAFEAGELAGDFVCVVRFQGPKANGMPELHGLTPILGLLQDRGQQVALVTDGRMSGASGKVPAAIHVSPEAMDGGPIAKIRNGDLIRLDVGQGTLEVLAAGFSDRAPEQADLSASHSGLGRELFAIFRSHVGAAAHGASPLFPVPEGV